MIREEAIKWLNKYRIECTFRPTKRLFGWKLNYEFMRAVYERILIKELIDRISVSDRNPIEIVRDFYQWMDDMVCSSENSKTWAFSSVMENCCSDILRYLIEKEKMKV